MIEEWQQDYKAMADSGDAGSWIAEEQPIYQKSIALVAEIDEQLNKGKRNA